MKRWSDTHIKYVHDYCRREKLSIASDFTKKYMVNHALRSEGCIWKVDGCDGYRISIYFNSPSFYTGYYTKNLINMRKIYRYDWIKHWNEIRKAAATIFITFQSSWKNKQFKRILNNSIIGNQCEIYEKQYLELKRKQANRVKISPIQNRIQFTIVHFKAHHE